MQPRSHRTAGMIALASFLALAASLGGAGTPSHALRAMHAQSTDIKVDVPLYGGGIGIRTELRDPPTVRVVDAGGRERTVVTPTAGPDENGYWFVELPEPGNPDLRVLLQPGDRIEVTMAGQAAAVTVPRMTATADVAAELVTGQVPPTSAVFLQLHYIQEWVGGQEEPQAITVPVDGEGRFRAELAGVFDLRPGTWGEVAMADADGNVFVVPFAPPAVTLYPNDYFALIYADPTTRPVLVIRNALGAEYLRTAPATPYWGVAMGVVLFPNGDFELGGVQPQPGQEVALLVDDRPAFAETMPWLTASVEQDNRAVWGFAPPGASVRVTLHAASQRDEFGGVTVPRGTPNLVEATTADGEGHYRLTFRRLILEATALAEVLAYPGGSVAYVARGFIPAQTVRLYGNQITGIIPGWGAVTVEHRPADSRPAVRQTVQASLTGEIEAALGAPGGGFALFAPGDRLTITPERGAALDLVVPELTAEVEPDQRTMHGTAPPDVPVDTSAYFVEPDEFNPEPYQARNFTLTGQSEPDGRFTLRCVEDERCRMRYGRVNAHVGSTAYQLAWVDQPIVGVGVSLHQVHGIATAGAQLTITPLDRAGQPGSARTGIVRPIPSEALPSWTVNLSDLYPDGLPGGTRLQVAVGSRTYNVQVPRFNYEIDVTANVISGTGPAGQYLYVVAIPPPGDASRVEYGFGDAIISPSGRWAVKLADFDLRPGDELDIYLYAENYYLWWSEASVAGEEPQPQPTATTQPAATATPGRLRERVFLPFAVRDVR